MEDESTLRDGEAILLDGRISSFGSDMNLLAEALLAFQSEVVTVEKTAENPFFRSRYADLAAIMLKCQPITTKHGLVVIQLPDNLNGVPALTTVIMHKSGQRIGGTIPLILQKQDPQGVGSAITYMRRYGYAAALQIVIDEDDDGNKASSSQSVSASPNNPELSKKIREIWKENGGTEEQLDVWVKKNNDGLTLDQISSDRQQASLRVLEAKKTKKEADTTTQTKTQSPETNPDEQGS